MKTNGKKRQKTFLEKLGIYHRYNKKVGLYRFFKNNYRSILIIAGAFIALVLLLNYFFDIETIATYIVDNYSTLFVLLIFYSSETILGLIPPDFFILWVKAFQYPYLMVGVLAIISYLGGLTAYGIGRRLRNIKRIKMYLEDRYREHVHKIRKWGGIFIVIAALLPLPYATICMLSGVLKYPFTRLLYLGIFRIARFFIYALVLYGVVR